MDERLSTPDNQLHFDRQLADGELCLPGRTYAGSPELIFTEGLSTDRLVSFQRLLTRVDEHDLGDLFDPAKSDRVFSRYANDQKPLFALFAVDVDELQRPVPQQTLLGHVSAHKVAPDHEALERWGRALATTNVNELAEVGTLLVDPEARSRRLSVELVRAAADEVRRRRLRGVAATAINNERGRRALVSGGFEEVAVLTDPKGELFRYFVLEDQQVGH